MVLIHMLGNPAIKAVWRIILIAFIVSPFTQLFVSMGLPYSLANFFSVSILGSLGVISYKIVPL